MSVSGYGTIQVQITGADVMGTLDLLLKSGISIDEPRWQDPLTLECEIAVRDREMAEKLCAKRGDTLKTLRKQGFRFFLADVLKRPVLLFGIFLLILFSVVLPRRILFVRVEGNTGVPERLILEAASQSGISFGASRVEVRSEKVKNALLHRVPQLQWAGVNTRGCVAVISVRERAVGEEKNEVPTFGHIIALRDGVVTSCTALAGTMLCAPGQAVREGDILISGYTNCGICIRAEQARGEVYGQTIRTVTATVPLPVRKQGKVLSEKKKISVLLGKKRIFLWKDSGIWDTTCDRMYEEYYVTLPGGFQLPLALSVERFLNRESAEQTMQPEQCRVILWESARRYLLQQMIAGSILDTSVDYVRGDESCSVTGRYLCTEMIGVMQRQQIGENHGKSD